MSEIYFSRAYELSLGIALNGIREYFDVVIPV